MSLHLREATLHDIPAIMAMELSGFAPGDREERSVYEERLSVFPSGALVAQRQGELVGCIFSELWRPRADYHAGHFELGHSIRERHDPEGGRELYIASMTIAPQARSQGAGALLFNGCIAHVRQRQPQMESALLLVNETWQAARRLYARSGFSELFTLPGFFKPHPGVLQDGVVMRKCLMTTLSAP